jgi:hypothetical protein
MASFFSSGFRETIRQMLGSADASGEPVRSPMSATVGNGSTWLGSDVAAKPFVVEAGADTVKDTEPSPVVTSGAKPAETVELTSSGGGASGAPSVPKRSTPSTTALADVEGFPSGNSHLHAAVAALDLEISPFADASPEAETQENVPMSSPNSSHSSQPLSSSPRPTDDVSPPSGGDLLSEAREEDTPTAIVEMNTAPAVSLEEKVSAVEAMLLLNDALEPASTPDASSTSSESDTTEVQVVIAEDHQPHEEPSVNFALQHPHVLSQEDNTLEVTLSDPMQALPYLNQPEGPSPMAYVQETLTMNTAPNGNSASSVNMSAARSMTNMPLDQVLQQASQNQGQHETDISSNVQTLLRLIQDLPEGVTKQVGAQIIRSTMEAMGIAMDEVLSEAQTAQTGLLDRVRTNLRKIDEYNSFIRKLQDESKYFQAKAGELGEVIDLFVMSSPNNAWMAAQNAENND